MTISFSLTRTLTTIAACAAALSAFGAARADMKVTETISMDMSKVTIGGQPVTADQIKMMSKFMPMFSGDGTNMTTYSKGSKSRIDSGESIIISDLGTDTSEILNTTDKTYYVSKFDPTPKNNGHVPKVDLKDLGTTQVILGHTCEGYEMTMTMQGMNYDGTMWTTTDFNMPASSFKFGNDQLDAFKDKMKGFPMKVDGKIISPQFGQMTMMWLVKSVSGDPLDDSVFAIPDGYKKTDKPTTPAGFTPPKQ